MGNWNITVRGQGSHHNRRYPKDANRLAARFVKDLKEAGHTVTSASITYGGEDDLKEPEAYLANRDASE